MKSLTKVPSAVPLMAQKIRHNLITVIPPVMMKMTNFSGFKDDEDIFCLMFKCSGSLLL